MTKIVWLLNETDYSYCDLWRQIPPIDISLKCAKLNCGQNCTELNLKKKNQSKRLSLSKY